MKVTHLRLTTALSISFGVVFSQTSQAHEGVLPHSHSSAPFITHSGTILLVAVGLAVGYLALRHFTR